MAMIAILCLASAEQLFQPMLRGIEPVAPAASPVAYTYVPAQSSPYVQYVQGFEEQSGGMAGMGALFCLGVAGAVLYQKKAALSVQGSTRRAVLAGALVGGVLPAPVLADPFEPYAARQRKNQEEIDSGTKQRICPGGDCPRAECVINYRGAQLPQGRTGVLKGLVKFIQDGDKCTIGYDITGLTPGAHGFSIRETPDFKLGCDSCGAVVASLGNITADASGRARGFLEKSDLSIVGTNSVVGRSMVVTTGADNAGVNAACGEIVLKFVPRGPVVGDPAFESYAERQRRRA